MPDSQADNVVANFDDLVALWRRDIAKARIKLVSEKLSPKQEADLWHAIECRERYIKRLSPHFEAELEQIDREIEAELRRH